MIYKTSSKIAYLIILSLFLTQCSNIDYSTVRAVPYESNKELVQITNENVAGPYVIASEEVINWYTPSYMKISPDGKLYAYFTYDIKNGQTEFNILIKNTSDNKLVLGKGIFGDVAGLDFSPNGKNIVFSAYNEGGFNIHILDIESGKINMNVINSKENETCPVYSKDGNTIFYSKAGKSAKAINEIPSATRTSSKFKNKTIKRNIHNFPYYIESKNFKENTTKSFLAGYSPQVIDDMGVLACINDADKGLGEIWRLNTETGIGNPLVKSYRSGYSTPCVSPDGKKIVFVGSSITKNSKTPINLNIYVANIDGTQVEQITFHPGHDVSPVWSKDMKWIYFISERGNENRKYNIWKIEYKNY